MVIDIIVLLLLLVSLYILIGALVISFVLSRMPGALETQSVLCAHEIIGNIKRKGRKPPTLEKAIIASKVSLTIGMALRWPLYASSIVRVWWRL